MVKKARTANAVVFADSGISFPSYGRVTTSKGLAAKRDAVKKLVQIEVRAWKYIYDGHIDEAVAAILAERPNAKLDPSVLRGQIVAYRPFFDSPSGTNIPFGVQTDADWSAAIKSMEQTGLIGPRSEEHTSELQSLMRISYAVFCLKKKKYIGNSNKSSSEIKNKIPGCLLFL